ncbi:MAG TPA: hypothetical protein VG228_00835 [Solirubrobacteraceae bacterium]|jgi:hypothetical protein|nr:hypothetical protein [Solirubrobacteraceae bacterium]
MRTSNMIYQAAIAHQTDLRRTASERPLRADRHGRPSAWNLLFSLATSHQQRAAAAAKPERSGIAIRRVSV